MIILTLKRFSYDFMKDQEISVHIFTAGKGYM